MWLWRSEWNLTAGSPALLSSGCHTRRVKLERRSGFPVVSLNIRVAGCGVADWDCRSSRSELTGIKRKAKGS